LNSDGLPKTQEFKNEVRVCWELGQSRTIQELARLVREYCPNIIFVSETRQQKDWVSNLRFRLGFRNSFVVDGVGKGGELGLFWDDSIKMICCRMTCITLAQWCQVLSYI
jgi:hypothetical protein